MRLACRHAAAHRLRRRRCEPRQRPASSAARPRAHTGTHRATGACASSITSADAIASAAPSCPHPGTVTRASAACSSTSPDALRAAQRAWLAYDKAQAQWDATLYAAQGTSAALNQGGASLTRRRARVCDLQNDLEGL